MASKSLLSAFLARAKIPKAFFWTYVLVVLYALAFQMISPTQLYLIKSLTQGEEAAAQFALIRTANGVAQLIGSLIAGVLVDKYGYRAVMLLSLVASAVCYFLMAVPAEAEDGDNKLALFLLYAAQIPTIFQHAILAGRAFISLRSLPERRAILLGYIGVCYGVGVVVGPAIGGFLSRSGLRLPAVAATALSVLSIVIALLAPTDIKSKDELGASPLPTAVSSASASAAVGDASGASDSSRQRHAGSQQLKEQPQPSQVGKKQGDEAAASMGALAKYATFFTTPVLLTRLGLKLLFSFSLAMFYSAFALVVADRFGMDSAQSGYLMSWFGAWGVFVQGFLIAALKARFAERTLCLGSGAAMAATFCALCFIRTPIELFAVAVPLVISSTLFQQINSSQVAEATPDALKGTAVALDMSLFSGLRLITPGLGAYLLKAIGYWTIGATSSSAAVAMVAVMVLFPTSVEGGLVAAAPAPGAAAGSSVAAAAAVVKPHSE